MKDAIWIIPVLFNTRFLQCLLVQRQIFIVVVTMFNIHCLQDSHNTLYIFFTFLDFLNDFLLCVLFLWCCLVVVIGCPFQTTITGRRLDIFYQGLSCHCIILFCSQITHTAIPTVFGQIV